MEGQPETASAGIAGRSLRYPDYLMPFVSQHPEVDQCFAELREQLLVGYGYNTARAYRADLDDLHDWASTRGLDVLFLTDAEERRYVALLRRRKYSENTIRRRLTALRNLRRCAGIGSRKGLPTPPSRRTPKK